VIDENGESVHRITPVESPILLSRYRRELMDTMVGYWNTQILYCIVRSGILDELHAGNENVHDMAEKLEFPIRSIEMLMDACKIWNLISPSDYSITRKGTMLVQEGPLHNAALMWGEEHYRVMGRLWNSLKTQEPQFKEMYKDPFFEYITHVDHSIYYEALEEYSLDYQIILDKLPLEEVNSIVDVGGATGILLKSILERFHNIEKGYLFDLPGVNEKNDFMENIRLVEGNFFSNPLPETESAILP